MKKISVLALGLIIALFSSFKEFDYQKSGYPIWRERVRPIVEGCTTSYEKAKAIFDWECANIAYDMSYSIYNAEDCWGQRKGVCQGYAELFVKLAAGCDLEAKVISGEARTMIDMDGTLPHAWVKVNTEKGWILIDPCWGAGELFDDHFVFEYKAFWFDADPRLMIFTHFPHNGADQLLKKPVTLKQYRRLPNVPPSVAFAGWKSQEVLNYYLQHLGMSSPDFYGGFSDNLGEFELVQVPYNGKMKVGRTYTLKIRSLASEAWADVHSWDANHHSEMWKKNGNLFTLVYRPKSEGVFYIGFKSNAILRYEVTK